MELKQAGERTYYIENNTNIGVYKTGENKVCLIDTGKQGDGEKIDEIISAQGWEIEYIINTHTHIDHLGGNEYLMKKYGIPAYCTAYDMPFAHFPDLEAAYMTGGYPVKTLRKVFLHPGMIGFRAIEDETPEGISWRYLPGHTFSMIGVKTPDDVWFLADSYISRNYLENYRYCYLYDVGGYMETLNMLRTLEGSLFVPAHGDAENDITEIVDMNMTNITEIISEIKDICSDFTAFDDIMRNVYSRFGIKANIVQNALIASTTRCYVSYLQDREELECIFRDNIMMWKCRD